MLATGGFIALGLGGLAVVRVIVGLSAVFIAWAALARRWDLFRAAALALSR
jgi:hypothetical protein